jgi:uncharacterized membrane protein
MEALHVGPLFIISGLLGMQFFFRFIKGRVIVIKQLDPLLLILSAIGIAAGSNSHGHELAHAMFDPCFGYAAVSLCIAARLLGLFNKTSIAKA